MVSALNCILCPIVMYIQTTALLLIKNNNNSCNGGSDLVNRTARLLWQGTRCKNSPGFFSFFASGILPGSSKKLLKTQLKSNAETWWKRQRLVKAAKLSLFTENTSEPSRPQVFLHSRQVMEVLCWALCSMGSKHPTPSSPRATRAQSRAKAAWLYVPRTTRLSIQNRISAGLKWCKYLVPDPCVSSCHPVRTARAIEGTWEWKSSLIQTSSTDSQRGKSVPLTSGKIQMGYILPNRSETKLLTWSLLYSWFLAARVLLSLLGGSDFGGWCISLPRWLWHQQEAEHTKWFFQDRLNWQQLRKPSLEFHKQTWPGAKQSPSWSIFPTATAHLPPERTSPSLTHPQVQLGDGSLPWATATPQEGALPKRSVCCPGRSIPHTPSEPSPALQAQQHLYLHHHTRAPCMGDPSLKISPSCESSAGLLSKIWLQASYQKIQ